MSIQLPISSHLAARTLVVLALVGAVSALSGAVMAVAWNGAGVPLEYLAGSPFSSYLIPGLILGVVVGGTQLGAAVAVHRCSAHALVLAAVAGFGMLIWIFVELAMIKQYSWLQSVYFAHGTLELILVLALLGAIPGLVHPLPPPSRR